MTYNALKELEAKSFFVSYTDQEPIEVILASDLQHLMDISDSAFESAVIDIKFSAIAQEINLKCFFHTIDQGDIMTTEAAIAVASRGKGSSEFTRQMANYVRTITDFCLDMAEEEIDTPDEE